jgi:transposase InsO family protein
VRAHVVEVAKEKLELTPRELAWYITDTERYYISESSVYRILKSYDLITSPSYIVVSAAEHFHTPTRAVHELWQTDFTYLKIVDWGWYYLSTIMDDFSRYIIAWLLTSTMQADDVIRTLERARAAAGLDQVKVRQQIRLLSDNAQSYLAKLLGGYIEAHDMIHIHSQPYHPMTQGKIERYHRTIKNVLLLNNYYQPAELEAAIAHFVEYYNNERYHESLNNLRPMDVYEGRGREILTEREKIKRETMRKRRKENLRQTLKRTTPTRGLTTTKSSRSFSP